MIAGYNYLRFLSLPSLARDPSLYSCLRFITLALLVWLPLPVGSNRHWSESLFIVVVATLAIACVASRISSRAIRPPVAQAPSRNSLAAAWMLTMLAITQVWVMLQWWLGLSEAPGETFRYGLLGTGYTLLFWLIITLFTRRSQITLLLSTLVASGAFQAFFGATMTLSGSEWLVFQPKEHYLNVVTGTFVNRNHLAGYLEMTIPCAIGLMLVLRNGRTLTWHGMLELILSPKLLLRLAIVIMVIGLVMTQSRSGNTGFVLSLLVVGAIFVLVNRQHRLRNCLLLASFITIDVLIVSQFFGLENLKNRIEQTRLQTVVVEGEVIQRRADRLDVADYVLAQIRDKPLPGIGAGAFESNFQQYPGPEIRLDFDHAHNDYLQFLAEFGVIGSLPLGIFTLIALVQAFIALCHHRSYWRSGLGFGAAMGILALMIHALTDFNHQIPANAATFIVLCALAVLANQPVQERKSQDVDIKLK